MRYRCYDYLPNEAVTGLSQDGEVKGQVVGRAVVPPEDGVEYVMYEARMEQSIVLSSPKPVGADGHGTNHVYYVISGSGRVCVEGGGGEEWGYSQDSVVGLPPSVRATLHPSTPTRLCVIHVDTDPTLPLPKPTYVTLQHILGSHRDVDWSGGKGQGRSRRFLNRAEGV